MYPRLMALLLCLAAAAQDRAAVASAAALLIEAEALAGARVGVAVYDLDEDRQLFGHDEDRGFMTASNMKLISSAVALHELGADFRFTTRVVAVGQPDRAVVDDLWLVGDGDPSLGGRPTVEAMAPMRALARVLQDRGVQQVRGDIIGDGSCQAAEPYGRGWQWDYLETYYAVPLSGLCFAENVVTLIAKGAGRLGAPPLLRSEPIGDELLLEHALRCAAAGSPTKLLFSRLVHDERVVLRGSIAADAAEQRLRVAVTDPARYAARALRAALIERGIEVAGQARAGRAPDAAVTLAEHASSSLAQIVDPLLRDSVNLYAEQLWWRAARDSGASSPSAVERHAKLVLQRLGVPVDGMLLADGSGLSRRNLVQPRQLAALLRAIWHSPLRDSIFSALPVAGVDGTLRRRFPAGGPCHGRVRAKTGFISYVVCLSGYLPRPEPARPLVFSAMVNNFTCPTAAAQAAIDAFLRALAAAAGWPAAGAGHGEVVPATGTGRRDRE